MAFDFERRTDIGMVIAILRSALSQSEPIRTEKDSALRKDVPTRFRPSSGRVRNAMGERDQSGGLVNGSGAKFAGNR